MGLTFFYEEVNVLELGGNLEQAGREAELAFFERLQATRIATGHTRSDQAETVIYRLLRGSGTAGLAGVLPVVGRRIRPLIDCGRTDVLDYLQSRDLVWREDASNADLNFARNRSDTKYCRFSVREPNSPSQGLLNWPAMKKSIGLRRSNASPGSLFEKAPQAHSD